MSLPLPEYRHLLALIDDTGIYEHARYGVPRREHGYTLDDAARALIVLLNATPTERMLSTQRVLLAFVLDSLTADGRFRNRLSFARHWEDWSEDDCGDAQGRGIWALCTSAATGQDRGQMDAARSALEDLAWPETPHLRPLAYAALGAHALWILDRDDPMASRLAEPAAAQLHTAGLPWPEPRLTYANASIPAAMMACGDVFDEPSLTEKPFRRSIGSLASNDERGTSLSPRWAAGRPESHVLGSISSRWRLPL